MITSSNQQGVATVLLLLGILLVGLLTIVSFYLFDGSSPVKHDISSGWRPGRTVTTITPIPTIVPLATGYRHILNLLPHWAPAIAWQPIVKWTEGNPFTNRGYVPDSSLRYISGFLRTGTVVTTDVHSLDRFEDKEHLAQLGWKEDKDVLSGTGQGFAEWGYIMDTNTTRRFLEFIRRTTPNNSTGLAQFHCPCTITIDVFLSDEFSYPQPGTPQNTSRPVPK